MFKYDFVANLQISLPVKELWKSINIWQNYHIDYTAMC